MLKERESIEFLKANSRNPAEVMSSAKRLDLLKIACMIDNGETKEARELLARLHEADMFLESEQDVKLLTYTFYGLPLKKQSKSHGNHIKGIRLIEQSK